MISDIGTVNNSQISRNRDSEQDQRLLSTEVVADSTQTVELSNTSGVDNNPMDGDTVLIINVADAYRLGILIDDGVAPDPNIKRGEKKIYSRDSTGRVSATIALKRDGKIILNEGSDFAVAFNALRTEFNELKNKFNSHVHTGVSSGGSSTGPTPQQSIANIDNAKVEKVIL